MNSEIRNKLFDLIRAGLGQSGINLQLSDEDYSVLLEVGTRQGINPILHRGLLKTAGSSAAIEAFDRARLKDIGQMVHISDAIEKISAALNEADIPYIPLKGAVLRNLYPEKSLRTSCDIDFLVKEKDLAKAVESIEAKTKFKSRKRNYHDISMVAPSVHLELHFNIKENMENIDTLLGRVWEYAVPDEKSRYKLTPEFQIFHVIAHMSYHIVHGGLGIRPFLDLWLLRTKTEFDEETVRQMCFSCNILTFYEKCCELADAWMTGKPVRNDLVMLEEYSLKGGVFGSTEGVLASKQREHRSLSYIFHRVFLSKKLMETQYPELKKKPYLLPVCHVHRWMRLLDPKRRRRIKYETKLAMTLNPESIDAYDALLASLGL